jgi:CSLREA domain-containing protein
MSANDRRPAPALRRFLPLLGAALLTGYLAFFAPSGAGATAFTVNSTVDAVDASPGDGACATVAGECTLRAAVQEANALPGADTITLPAATYLLEIQGGFDETAAAGDLDISDDLEINGAGAAGTIIDGGRFRGDLLLGDDAFHVHPGASAVISDVTIQAAGHILSAGGGILNNGTLTLNSSILRENQADSGAGVLNRGGALTVNNSSFIQNTGGTGSAAGAGVLNAGTMTLDHVTFTGNTAGFGGGGVFNVGVATLNDVALADNYSEGGGGGILNGGIMTLNNSTLQDNFGNGIFNDGDLTASNVTISGTGGFGILNRHAVALTNVTVTGSSDVGIFNHNAPLPPGGIPPPGLTLTIENSVIAGNGGANCGDSNPDLESTTSAGHNLSSDGTCPFTAPGDFTNTDPLLGPLADNGGPTQTHALLAGSPAIDAGDDADCPATDQRGFLRPADGDADGSAICDIGAYEFGATAPTPTPTAAPSAEPTPTPGATATPTPVPTLVPSPTPTARLPAALPETGGNPARLT